MKISTSIFLLIVFFYTSHGQNRTIESLIQDINNNQIQGVCHHFWFIEMKSPSGNLLIEKGKSISNKLFDYLDDQEKGIIAHYILWNIWHDKITFSSSFEDLDENGIIEYEYCGLEYYEKDGLVFTSDELLLENKRRWREKLIKINR